MDTLLKALKELQKERNLLEQELNDKRHMRCRLEQECDQARERHSHMQNKFMQTSDFLTVAQQKMSHTQAASLSLQEEINSYMLKLDSLQHLLEIQKETQIKSLHDFETALSKISSELFQAKLFYRKSSLIHAINETIKDINTKELTITHENEGLHNLQKCLVKLNTEINQCENSSLCLENAFNIFLRLFEKDRQDAENELEQMKIKDKQEERQ